MSRSATHAALHQPVLVDEVLSILAPKNGETFVDGTFGAGGYTRAILSAADCKVYAFDRDPEAIALGRELAREFAPRLTMIEGCFSGMEEALAQRGETALDGLALDVGVSSMQLDTAERGFSLMNDGPLDMRMGADGETAAEVVNRASEEELRNIFWRFGEEKSSRKIARAICEQRALQPIRRTLELADVVSAAKGPGARRQKIHPATKVFQALRIFINDELGELQAALQAAERLLVRGGRLCVVSFHSLEDRIVKRFLRERSGATARPSRHLPEEDAGGPAPAPTFDLARRKPLRAGREEVARNPRARSALLRSGIRTAAAPWSGRAAVAGEGGRS